MGVLAVGLHTLGLGPSHLPLFVLSRLGGLDLFHSKANFTITSNFSRRYSNDIKFIKF